MQNETSAAATSAALAIRKIPLSLADIWTSLFECDEADKEKVEQMIVIRLATIIETETQCGILLRVAEEAKKYAGSTTDCCMGGERTSELCDLHQALQQWEYIKNEKHS